MPRPVAKDLHAYEPYYKPTHGVVSPYSANAMSQSADTTKVVGVLAVAAGLYMFREPIGKALSKLF